MLKYEFHFSPGIDGTSSILKSENPNHRISRLQTALIHAKYDKEVRSRKLKSKSENKSKSKKR